MARYPAVNVIGYLTFMFYNEIYQSTKKASNHNVLNVFSAWESNVINEYKVL